MSFGYIYKFTLTTTGKIYVGKREKSKFDEKYYGSGRVWQRAIEKYGKENVLREVLEWCDSREELNECEKKWISELNSTDKSIGYNIAEGGDGGSITKGYFHVTDGDADILLPPNTPIPDGFHLGGRAGFTRSSESIENYKASWTPERRAAFSSRCKGENNSNYGNHKMAGGSNSKAIHYYYYKDLKFDTRLDLWAYINNTLGIEISKNTITNICKGEYGVRIKSKYPSLVGNIRRELKCIAC